MTPAPEHEPTLSEKRVLLVLLLAVSAALVWILLPFYGTILWGMIIALLFAPLYRRLLPRLGHKRTPAALLTLLLVLVIVILPLAVVAAALSPALRGEVFAPVPRLCYRAAGAGGTQGELQLLEREAVTSEVALNLLAEPVSLPGFQMAEQGTLRAA